MARNNVQPKSIEERFWPKVNKTEGCWLWMGARLPKGYGVIGRGGRGSGYAYAHRVSYEIARGPIPEGHQLHHTCTNASCVRPDHLRLVETREHKRIHSALPREAITLIRSSNWTNAKLARAFRVDPSTISRIRSGEHYPDD